MQKIKFGAAGNPLNFFKSEFGMWNVWKTTRDENRKRFWRKLKY